jgi:hypothetical protein
LKYAKKSGFKFLKCGSWIKKGYVSNLFR